MQIFSAKIKTLNIEKKRTCLNALHSVKIDSGEVNVLKFTHQKRFKKFLFSRILNFTRTEIHRLDPLSVLLDPPLHGAWGAWLNALH